MIALVGVGWPTASRAEIDVLHYDLELSLQPDSKSISAFVELTVVHDGVSPLVLDLVGFEVASVAVDGNDVSFARGDRTLEIAVEDAGAGDELVVGIAYAGPTEANTTPWGVFGLVWKDNRAYPINVTDGARYWFPSHDRVHDKATVTFTLHVPDGWVATAPGANAGVNPWVYVADWPITPYLIAFYAGTYERVDETHAGVPVSYWLHPTSWAKAAPLFEDIGPMLQWLQSRYGPYPFPALSWAEISLGGAIEVPSCIGIGTQVVGSTNLRKEVIVHELAHSWFQGVVTIASWDDIWLSEGLAAYHEVLWDAHINGPEALGDQMDAFGMAYRSIAELLEGFFPLYAPDEYFGYTVYRKGAYVWHTLRGLLGDTAFDALLNDYLTTYAGSVASSWDLQALVDEGYDLGMPADAFFEQWLLWTGFPHYDVTWRLNAQGTHIRIRVTQPDALGQPYTTPLELIVRGELSDVRATITFEQWTDGEADILVPVSGPMTELIVDPDRWLLHTATVTALAQETSTEPDVGPEPQPEPAPSDVGETPEASETGSSTDGTQRSSTKAGSRGGCSAQGGETPNGLLWVLTLLGSSLVVTRWRIPQHRGFSLALCCKRRSCDHRRR